MKVQGYVAQLGLVDLTNILYSSTTAHACIFVNFKLECTKWATELDVAIAEWLINANVVTIYGDQDMDEKFAFTRLLTTSIKLKTFFPHVLIAMATGNTGTNQIQIG